MAQNQLKGVGGVLSNLISQPEEPPPSPQGPPPPSAGGLPEGQDAPEVRARETREQRPSGPRESTSAREARPARKEGARRGRPPAGTRTDGPVEREKVSLRLRADLAATYRDWSWEEHCQFSDLVDRAMEFYMKSRGKARKPERE